MKSYDARFLKYGARQTESFVILGHFLPFYPTNNPKNQNFEKYENPPRDIIILHKCTIRTQSLIVHKMVTFTGTLSLSTFRENWDVVVTNEFHNSRIFRLSQFKM